MGEKPDRQWEIPLGKMSREAALDLVEALNALRVDWRLRGSQAGVVLGEPLGLEEGYHDFVLNLSTREPGYMSEGGGEGRVV